MLSQFIYVFIYFSFIGSSEEFVGKILSNQGQKRQ